MKAALLRKGRKVKIRTPESPLGQRYLELPGNIFLAQMPHLRMLLSDLSLNFLLLLPCLFVLRDQVNDPASHRIGESLLALGTEGDA